MSDGARLLYVGDDPQLYRLTERLSDRRGYTCERCRSGRQAEASLAKVQPDVAFLELRHPDQDGRFLRTAAQSRLPTSVLAIAHRPSVATAVAVFRLGVVDYLTRPISAAGLDRAVDTALSRRRAIMAVRRAQHMIALCSDWFLYLDELLVAPNTTSRSPAALTMVLRHEPSEGSSPPLPHPRLLSRRERQVLQAVASGLRPRDIAETFKVSIHTARAHVKAIMRKLGVHLRADFVRSTGGIPRLSP